MRFATIFVFILITSCTRITSNSDLVTQHTDLSEILVFRAEAFQPHYLDAYFGVHDKYFVILQNDQYAKFKIDSGMQELQVKSKSSPASRLSLELTPNSTTCLEITPNPVKLGVYAVPTSGYFIPSFNLTHVACPKKEFLGEFTITPIS